MPEWTEAEHALAREIQRKAEIATIGLHTVARPLKGPAVQGSPCNDCGDVSWAVPMGRLSFPASVPGVPFHHWTAGVALASSIAHKGAVAGTKALAGAVIDLLTDPALVQRAKETFREELGGVTYRPLLPAGQKPPLRQAPCTPHQGDGKGQPDQPAYENAEGENHSRLDHSGSATPLSAGL